jgi:hypothetical protein
MYPNYYYRRDTRPVKKIKEPFEMTDFGGTKGLDEGSIADRIKKRIDQYENECVDNFKRAELNRKYATNHFEERDYEDLVLDGETPIFVPKIKENFDTAIPLITQKTPEPEILIKARKGVGSKSKMNNVSRSVQIFCKEFWEMDNYMQKKMEESVRNYFCQGYLAVKYYWDTEANRPELYPIAMGNIIIPLKETRDTNKIPFIGEKVSDLYADLKRKFFMTDTEPSIDENGQEIPSESVLDEEKVKSFEESYNKEDLKDDTLINYIEYWESEGNFVAWIYEDFLFDVQPNPNFNFGDDTNPGVNHFTLPQMPYIFENAFSFGDGIADDSTPIESSRSLQDNINRTKRQLDLNQDDANGLQVINGDVVSDEDADKLDRSRQNKIVAKSQDRQSVDLNNVVTYVSSRGMGPEAQNNMAHSELHIDQDFGTNAVTRGEQQSVQTATGQQILKDSDKEKNSPLTRMVERVAQKVFNGLMQLMYVYSDEEYSLYTDGADSSVSNNLNKETLYEYVIKIQVKDGSTVPRNPAVMKVEIVDLAKAGMASLIDMYRDLGYDDPEGRAKRAVLEKTDPMSLYGFDGNLDVFNAEAVMALIDIVGGTKDPMSIYESTDMKMFQSYLKTMTDYLAGKEIDPDIPLFLDLDDDTKQKIQTHVQANLDAFQELQMQEQQMALMMGRQDMLQPMAADQAMADEASMAAEGGMEGVSNLTGSTEATPLETSPQQAAVI